MTAVAISGLAAPLALGLAAALARDEADTASAPVDCPHCGAALKLSAQELDHGWYICPACRLAALILDSVTCPHCHAELELSDDELARQSFECPQCAHHVTMA
jgi:transposase-like protein